MLASSDRCVLAGTGSRDQGNILASWDNCLWAVSGFSFSWETLGVADVSLLWQKLAKYQHLNMEWKENESACVSYSCYVTP